MNVRRLLPFTHKVSQVDKVVAYCERMTNSRAWRPGSAWAIFSIYHLQVSFPCLAAILGGDHLGLR